MPTGWQHDLLEVVALVVAALSAVRGIWSPCGLSMLTSINPFAERGRRHRYALTASWFVVGALLGGATLGIGIALAALAVHALGPSAEVALALASVATLAASLADLGIFGIQMPVLRRQVNERWLDQYRGWFYGLGFGWQIGAGLTTYVMTAGVFATVALSCLGGSWLFALTAGCVFGLVRGLGVFVGARASSPTALRQLLSRLDGRDRAMRLLVAGVLLLASLLLAVSASPWMGIAVVLVGLGGLGTMRFSRARVLR